MRRLVVLFAIGVSACSGKSPTGPSSPPPAVVTITGVQIQAATDLYRVGFGETFSAVASRSDGTTIVITSGVVWAADNASVGSMDSTGRFAPVGPGLTTVTASYQGTGAAKLIRVVPDYQGSWQGTTLTTGCTAILDYERGGLCAAFVGRAQTGVFLSQSRDTVSGQLFIGTFPLTVTGTIGQPGGVTLTGSGSTNGFDIVLVSWSTFAQGSSMTGTFTFRVSGGGVSGNVTVSTTIDRLTR
jgi:hypothetical protein